MDEEFLKNCIDNGYENEYLDYKLEIYEFEKGNNKGKEDFLIDVLSMANSNYLDDKYIIIGEKVRPDGERIKKGVDITKVKDSADYQQIVSENIEPSISIEFNIIEHDNLKYGIFKISNCNNRPYLMKKDYETIRAGFMKIRHGSRNDKMSRFDLDSIYNAKKVIEKTDFRIFGIDNGNLSEKINIKNFECFSELMDALDIIPKKFEEINTFIIDDVKAVTNSCLNTVTAFNNFFVSEEKVELLDTEIDYIKQYIDACEIKVNDDFFSIGNVTRKREGFASYSNGIFPEYKIYGSNKSIEKYNKIKELNNIISSFVHMKEFEESIKKFYYLELAIKEIGNIADEEIEVNLILPKGCYIDVEDFPQVHECISDKISDQYSKKLFIPKYGNEISDFRKMVFQKAPVIPKTTFPLLGTHKTKYDIIDNIYDFIDYDVQEEKDKTILKFIIKNIKVNESMVFPGNIILKNKIEKIRYFIVSKKSNKTITGDISINN